MDTIYYHLNARKVKVSGGADLVTFVPSAVPAPAKGAGEVLDFARCRRRLETRQAWKALAQTAREEHQEAPAPREEAPRPRRERAANMLELAASAAVIAVSLAAVAAFLRLL